MSDWLVKAENVGVKLGGRPILQDISFELQRGQLVTLIGPNGAGKTTLVRIVLGLMTGYQGKLRRQQGLRLSLIHI